MEAYRDKHGIPFAAYSDLLPRVADWPKVKRIRDVNLGRQMHFLWQHCTACGRSKKSVLQMHHMFRSDELCAVIMLCARHGDKDGCHQQYEPRSNENIGLLLWAKWRIDPCNTDWVRMALLAGRFLPEPMPDARLLAEYRERTGQRKSWET